MKKLFLSLGLALGTLLNANATTLVIENNCHTYVCIQDIETNKLNGVNYEFFYGICNFSIDSGDVFQITDGDLSNFQFPFLNVWPFAGNVWEETVVGSTLAPLPLPSVGNAIPQNTRYQLYSFKFELKGAGGTGFSPDTHPDPNLAAQGFLVDDAYYSGIYHFLPGQPEYDVTYFKMGSIYLLSFNDL